MIGSFWVWEPSATSCRTCTNISIPALVIITLRLLRLRLLILLRKLQLPRHDYPWSGKIRETFRLINTTILLCCHELSPRIRRSLKSLKISRIFRLIILIIVMITIQGWVTILETNLTLHISKLATRTTTMTTTSITVVLVTATSSRAAKTKVHVVVNLRKRLHWGLMKWF